ncbi:MAG: TonB-dependent receptor, partial [Gammaproteobacteria bacterium]|nr:TonB-dependent receptor [Gammaproteobacteria bacterium]
RTSQSAHINANYIGDTFLAEVAIRYDDIEKVASDTSINIGLGYRFNPQHQLSLNLGEGFKAPTFNDLYFPWGGDENLKFETSENTELVYKGFYDTGSLVISLFDSAVDNLIQWIPDAGGFWAPQNVGEADISGVEASYKFSYGNYNHTITASSISSEDGTTGQQLLLRAKKHFGYEFSYTGDNFDIFTQFQHVGERPETDLQTELPTMLDSYTQVNIGASYTFDNKWQLKLKISDALDEAPTLVSGYNPAGRKFYLTLVHQNLF